MRIFAFLYHYPVWNWNNSLDLNRWLSPFAGAIPGLCIPLPPHEAKLWDWKQLCQGQDAGLVGSVTSSWFDIATMILQVTMSLSSLVAEVSPIFRFNEVKSSYLSIDRSGSCETFRNTWESPWRPSWRTPSKIVSCQIPSTPSQNRYNFGIMAYGVLPSLYFCWNAPQTPNILPVSKGCKEASQQEKFGDEFDIIGQLCLLSLKLHICTLCLFFWY